VNATEIIFAARDLGIRLSVTEDDGIEYRPKSSMTPELLGEIRANKEALIRDLLMADALRYLSERYVEGTDLSALDALESQLEDTYADGDLVAYREAIREFVRAGLREIERAKPRGSSEVDETIPQAVVKPFELGAEGMLLVSAGQARPGGGSRR
jgi:hypothetical protein